LAGIGKRERHLRLALAESLTLQAHYAQLLNQYDGGERQTFPNVDAWLDRLAEIGKFDPFPPEPAEGEAELPPEGCYRVRWEIDCAVGPDGPVAAAREALDAQRRPGTSAVVFDVFDHLGNVTRIDFEDECEPPSQSVLKGRMTGTTPSVQNLPIAVFESMTGRMPSQDPPIQNLSPPAADPADRAAIRAAFREDPSKGYRWGYWDEEQGKFIGENYPTYQEAVDHLDPRLSVLIRRID
jgi:hypothetical protein